MGLDLGDLRNHVVRPVLVTLGLWSRPAEDLVIGTAIQESRARYLAQRGGGPALGIWQMEPATHEDIWANFLKYRTALAASVAMFRAPNIPDALQLKGNLLYGAALCRVHYYRAAAPLPNHGDVDGYAAYWKRFYNTPLGRGTAAEFALHYRAAHKEG